MPIRIKICGITRLEDAKVAINLGVDALGFIFYPKSPRFIEPKAAAALLKQLPPFVSKVGVFVNETVQTVTDIAFALGLDTIQLHGNESPEFCKKFTCSVIKSFSVGNTFDRHILTEYDVSGILLDTWDERKRGGTGHAFDWEIAAEIAEACPHVILAGGLGPANIRKALGTVIPYAVDVNSGVEIMPGVKNPHKMREVVKIVKMFH